MGIGELTRFFGEGGEGPVEGHDLAPQRLDVGFEGALVLGGHGPVTGPHALEREARTHRRGLWAQPRPTPPWQYRHRYGTR